MLKLSLIHIFMEKLPYVMNSGGRIAVLTFHSGEDRLVKKALDVYKRQVPEIRFPQQYQRFMIQ